MTFDPVGVQLDQVVLRHDGGFSLGPVTRHFPSGAWVQLLGPNGSGKTSFLRALAGFLRPEKGSVAWEAPSYEERPFKLFLSETLGALKTLSVYEQGSLWARLYGAGEQQIQKALAFFSMETLAERPISTLSAGERQRVSLMRLLLSDCPVWLLDEPFNFIDAPTKQAVFQLMQEHVKKGGSVFFSTHVPVEGAGLITLTVPQDFSEEVA